MLKQQLDILAKTAGSRGAVSDLDESGASVAPMGRETSSAVNSFSENLGLRSPSRRRTSASAATVDLNADGEKEFDLPSLLSTICEHLDEIESNPIAMDVKRVVQGGINMAGDTLNYAAGLTAAGLTAAGLTDERVRGVSNQFPNFLGRESSNAPAPPEAKRKSAPAGMIRGAMRRVSLTLQRSSSSTSGGDGGDDDEVMDEESEPMGDVDTRSEESLKKLGIVQPGKPRKRRGTAYRRRTFVSEHQYLLQCDHRQSFAFYALSELGRLNGYKEHLIARARLEIFEVNWMDIMMWSTLMGHFELSRLLWLKTSEPLRAAVIASRMCEKLKDQMSNDAAWSSPALMEELHRGADLIEDWAVGILDQFQRPDDAVMSLTCIPARRLPKDLNEKRRRSDIIRLWPQSVISVASFDTVYPCRRVIAHHHSQHVVQLYFLGQYRGSRAAVPRGTTIPQIVAQCLVHLVLAFMFWLPKRYFPQWLRGPCRVSAPIFTPASLMDETDDKDLERNASRRHLEIAELDEDYFQDHAAKMENEAKWQFPKKAVNEMHENFKKWCAFWSIPKVKYISHLFCSFIFLLLLVLMLVAPLGMTDLDGAGPAEPIQFRVNDYVVVEMLYWIFYLGMLVAKVQNWWKKALRKGHNKMWRRFRNLLYDVEAWIVVFNSVAFSCRMIILNYQMSELTSCEELGLERINRLWDSCNQFSVHLGTITQLELEMLVLTVLCALLRFVAFLRYTYIVGNTSLMVGEMIKESGGVLLMMFFTFIGAGLAFVAKLPAVLPGTKNITAETQHVVNLLKDIQASADAEQHHRTGDSRLLTLQRAAIRARSSRLTLWSLFGRRFRTSKTAVSSGERMAVCDPSDTISTGYRSSSSYTHSSR